MKQENSIVKSGMISSLSLFLTKFLGIIYIIPLNAILATSVNRDYYAVGFKVYEIILSISIAGFPIAVATLVSRYEAQGNHAYAHLVKKYGGYVLSFFGFVIMSALFLFANPIAAAIKNPAPAHEIQIVATMLRILAVAIFIVANLGSLRGYYQGIKQITMYSFSQFIEQVVRVAIIVFGGFLVVNLLKFDRIFAVYITAFAATLSAFVAYGLLWLDYRKKHYQKVSIAQDYYLKRQIISETIRIAIPYMSMALLAYANSIIDLSLFSKVFASLNFSLEARKEIFTALTMQGEKLIAIPLVIATGFSVASLPYLNETLEQKKWATLRKQIEDILSIVLLIAIPLCAVLFFFAAPAFFIFFGNTLPQIGVPIVRVSALVAIVTIVANISIAISMAINMRKFILFTYVIFLIVKLVWYYPSVVFFQQYGPLVSTFIATIVQLVIILYTLKMKFQINLSIILKRFIGIIMGFLAMAVIGIIFMFLPIQYRGLQGMLLALFFMSLFGGLALIAYVFVTSYFQLPQRLLQIDIRKILGRKK